MERIGRGETALLCLTRRANHSGIRYKTDLHAAPSWCSGRGPGRSGCPAVLDSTTVPFFQRANKVAPAWLAGNPMLPSVASSRDVRGQEPSQLSGASKASGSLPLNTRCRERVSTVPACLGTSRWRQVPVHP